MLEKMLSKLTKKKRKNAGGDPFLVQQQLLHGVAKPVVLDVGAYVGNVTRIYREILPDAAIHSFEPFPASFEQLARSTEGQSVKTYNVAVSDAVGTAELFVDSDPTCNSFLPRPTTGKRYYSDDARHVNRITVPTTTIDAFCDRERIPGIDILKLDMEGAEIKALHGAVQKLSRQEISIVYTEVMFVPIYAGGSLFHELASYLGSYGYTLFGLYDLKWARNGQLRYGNAIFLSPSLRAKMEQDPTP